MRSVTATLCAAVAAFSLGSGARADDLALPGMRPPVKIDQDINQAAGIVVDKSPADVDSEVKDLDATRAAIDKQKVPAISLSVSGWVSQEVQ
jgi:hypothetical protein